MRVIDLLEILAGGVPTVRIIDINAKRKDNHDPAGIIACEYVDSIFKSKHEWAAYEVLEVKKFKVTHEVSHIRYKERGLIPPFRPDLTAEYLIGDLQQKTFYDIYINAGEAGIA